VNKLQRPVEQLQHIKIEARTHHHQQQYVERQIIRKLRHIAGMNRMKMKNDKLAVECD